LQENDWKGAAVLLMVKKLATEDADWIFFSLEINSLLCPTEKNNNKRDEL